MSESCVPCRHFHVASEIARARTPPSRAAASQQTALRTHPPQEAIQTHSASCHIWHLGVRPPCLLPFCPESLLSRKQKMKHTASVTRSIALTAVWRCMCLLWSQFKPKHWLDFCHTDTSVSQTGLRKMGDWNTSQEGNSGSSTNK